MRPPDYFFGGLWIQNLLPFHTSYFSPASGLWGGGQA